MLITFFKVKKHVLRISNLKSKLIKAGKAVTKQERPNVCFGCSPKMISDLARRCPAKNIKLYKIRQSNFLHAVKFIFSHHFLRV